MREILFRGKRIDNGEFVYGYVGVFKGTTQIYVPFTEEEEKENEGHIFSVIGGLWHTVHHETIGQFTGLTDKNGKKIFEGDIVANAWERGVVSYGEFNCSCCDGVFGWSFGNADIREYDGYEVIGNIHDNPDLLNK